MARFAALALLLFAVVVHGEAGLQWEQTTISVAADPADEEAKAVFRFTNDGESDVTITRVDTTCGCTVPQLAKHTYAPGESGSLEVTFSFNSMVGKQAKNINVATDSAETPWHVLTFEVDIPKLFELQRHFLVWRKGEEPVAKTLDLLVTRPDLARIVGVESKNDRFTARIESSDTPGRYLVVVTPASTSEVVQSSFIVNTDFPAQRPKVVTLYALVR
jgi:hypothetical protein